MLLHVKHLGSGDERKVVLLGSEGHADTSMSETRCDETQTYYPRVRFTVDPVHLSAAIIETEIFIALTHTTHSRKD